MVATSLSEVSHVQSNHFTPHGSSNRRESIRLYLVHTCFSNISVSDRNRCVKMYVVKPICTGPLVFNVLVLVERLGKGVLELYFGETNIVNNIT